jgi:hypothetical protein
MEQAMTSVFRPKLILCRWLPAALLAVILFSGCKECQPRDEGLRASGLTDTARQARSENDGQQKKSVPDDPWMSDKANQINRNLQ